MCSFCAPPKPTALTPRDSWGLWTWAQSGLTWTTEMHGGTRNGSLGICEHSRIHSVGLGCWIQGCRLNLDTCFNQTKEEASIPALSPPAVAHVVLGSEVLPNHCWQSDHLDHRAKECIISHMCYSKWITNNVAGLLLSKWFLQHSEPYHSVKALRTLFLQITFPFHKLKLLSKCAGREHGPALRSRFSNVSATRPRTETWKTLRSRGR